MKRCSKCGADKPHIMFSKNKSKNDGYQTFCKECSGKYFKRYRDTLPKEYWDKYAEKRRLYHAEWQLKNKDKVKKYSKNWSDNNREKTRENARDYYRRKRNTLPAVNRAHVISQRCKRNTNCEICNSTKNLERHHYDYSKPYEFATLCRSCHCFSHNMLKTKNIIIT